MLYTAIVNLGFLLLGINLLLYIKEYRNGSQSWKIFTAYLFTMSVIQLITSYLSDRGIHNLFLSHFYFILQFLFLSFFYLDILKDRFQRKVVFAALFLCPAFLAVQYASDPGLFFRFNLIEIFITSFLIVIYAMFHFYNILSSTKQYYYLNMGIFIYLFGSTIFFLCGNLIITLELEYKNVTWFLNAVLYLCYQIFIFIDWKQNSGKINKNAGAT